MKAMLLDPAFGFWVPLGVALVCMVPTWLTRSRTIVNILRVTAVSLVVLGVLAAAFWSFLLRDGLGPGFVPTTGMMALRRFWDGFAVPLAIGAGEALAITILSGRRLRKLGVVVAVRA
jgi:hypothetical protein